MKNTFPVLVLLISLTMYYLTALAFDAKQKDRTEAEIWKLENTYVSCFRDAAHDEIIPMWHDQFLGWPGSEPMPTDKNGVIGFLKKYASIPGGWSFEIEPAGIQIHGDVAITHFIIHSSVNPNTESQYNISTRVTHTWIRESSQWKILGGMSAIR